MNSSYHHDAKRGFNITPPTAPLPRPHHGDLGSLCPPPPPPPPRTSTNGNYLQLQSIPLTQIKDQQTVTSCQQNYGSTPVNYQTQHYQFPQNFHLPNQQAYPQYSNFLSPPPPPPPPPPPAPPQPWINSTNNMHIKANTHHPRHLHENNRHDKHTNASQGGVKSDKIDDSKTNKKINPKMAKKYSGRGLKTITISGPGMPTQKFKICVGNHPDDVKKWIEERRKRFPRVGDTNKSTVRCSENSVGGCIDAVIAAGKRGRQEEVCVMNGVPKKQCTGEPSFREILADRKARGAGVLSSLLSGYDSSSSQEESGTAEIPPDSGSAKEEATLKESSTNKSFDIDSTTRLSQNVEVVSTTLNSSPTGRTRPCRYFKRGNCRHGDSCNFLHSKSDGKAAETDRDSERKVQSEQDKASRRYEYELQALGLVSSGQAHRDGNKRVGQFVNNTSLLNKLLQRDREREWRLTLQLLRYVVNCDFFQGGTNAGGLMDDVGTSGDHFEANEQPVIDRNENPNSTSSSKEED